MYFATHANIHTKAYTCRDYKMCPELVLNCRNLLWDEWMAYNATKDIFIRFTEAAEQSKIMKRGGGTFLKASNGQCFFNLFFVFFFFFFILFPFPLHPHPSHHWHHSLPPPSPQLFLLHWSWYFPFHVSTLFPIKSTTCAPAFAVVSVRCGQLWGSWENTI